MFTKRYRKRYNAVKLSAFHNPRFRVPVFTKNDSNNCEHLA